MILRDIFRRVAHLGRTYKAIAPDIDDSEIIEFVPQYDQYVDDESELLLRDARDSIVDAIREARCEGRQELVIELAELLISLDDTLDVYYGKIQFGR